MTLSTRIGVMNAGRIVQVGEPPEIYEYPNSKFVADFIGSVNMFEGRVTEDEPDYVRLAVPELEGEIHVGHGVSCTLNQLLWYAVRPEKIRLTRARPEGVGERLPGLGRGRRLHGQPVDLPDEARERKVRPRDAGEPHAPRGGPDHLARGRLGLVERHRGRGPEPMSGAIERVPPLRWTAALLRRLGLDGRGLVVAVPLVWLLVFFLIPFLVVAKLSVSEPAIAMPPYLPIWEWQDGQLVITLSFGNFSYLFEDPLYVNAYVSSLKIAFVSATLALLVGYPMAYYIAR